MKLNQLISSKINTAKFLSILMIASTIFMSGCNVKEVLTDANGQKKSFILFNPNFLLTNYQIRLVDSLNNFITEDLRVEVLSNKKIVNDEGYYTKSFTTSNGLVNFSVDPNENISAADSIEFSVLVSSDKNNFIPMTFRYKSNSKFDRIFKMIVKNIPSNITTSTIESNSINSKKASATYTYSLFDEIMTIDGEELLFQDFNKTYRFPNLDPHIRAMEVFPAILSKDYNSYIIYNASGSSSVLSKDIKIKIAYKNSLDANTLTYTLYINGKDPNGDKYDFSVNRDGSTYYFDNPKSKWIQTGPSPNWLGDIVIPKGTKITTLFFSSNRTNTELKNCPQGFNFNFTNISKETSPEFEYIAYRNDKEAKRFYISNAGVAKVDTKNPTYNTGELLYSNISNKVVFKENSQYYLEPSTIMLDGFGACASKTDIKIIPKANMVKYKLAIEAQCKESNYAVTPSINMLFRKKGSKEWEGLTVKNGIGTIYLENNADYEVTGTAGKSKLNFDFSNNPASFDTQKASSLSKNPDLSNMIYSITDDANEAGTKILKMKVVYNQVGCPLN